MAVHQYHREERIRKPFPGRIYHQGVSYACLVEDVSSQGLQLISAAYVEVGDFLYLDLKVSNEMRVTCVLDVRHIHGDGLGGRIIDITDSDSRILGQLLQECYSTQLAHDTR